MSMKLNQTIRKVKQIGFSTSLKTLFRKKEKNIILAHKFIKKYGKKINEIYQEYANIRHLDFKPEKNIFVFWYQTADLNKLPPCARLCINRIYELYGKEFKIHFISKDNLKQYVEVDTHIEKLLENNKIKIQNFSDYIRFKLVNTYGGYRIDTTVLFSGHFDLISFNSKYSFFSLNCKETRNFLHDEKDTAKHCSWFFSAWKDSPITYIFYKFFEYYYKRNDTQFGYFMVDYVLFSMYKINDLKIIFNQIPETDISPNNFINNIKSGRDVSALKLEVIEKLSNTLVDEKLANIIQNKLDLN